MISNQIYKNIEKFPFLHIGNSEIRFTWIIFSDEFGRTGNIIVYNIKLLFNEE